MQILFPTTLLTRWTAQCRMQQIWTSQPRIEELTARKVLTASFPRGGKITCARGTLWITCYGKPEDILVHAESSLVCERGSRLVIEALENATVEITDPLPWDVSVV